MSKELTTIERLRNAKATSKETLRALEDAARGFALGSVSSDELAAAAKKHTNAMHAVGRHSKHKKEGI